MEQNLFINQNIWNKYAEIIALEDMEECGCNVNEDLLETNPEFILKGGTG